MSMTNFSLMVDNPKSSKRQNQLNDIIVMRVLLVVLLLVYHAFSPFCGSWPAIDSFQANTSYEVIGLVSYSFFLEAFVFISGMLVGVKIRKSPNAQNFSYLVLKKFKRLIIPSILFSFIYYFLFYDTDAAPARIVYEIMNGCGHLWFLPMLFWCFIGLWLLSASSINPWIVLIFSFSISFLSNNILPFRIGSSIYYFVFFYIGYGIERGQFKFIRSYSKSRITTMSLIFIVSLFSHIYMRGYLIDNQIINFAIAKSLKLIIAISGILMSYWVINHSLRDVHNLPKWLENVSSCSFGIYILQQFILKGLYYHTDIPYWFDEMLVPWIGLVIAFVVSYIGSSILLSSKYGRLLIG